MGGELGILYSGERLFILAVYSDEVFDEGC